MPYYQIIVLLCSMLCTSLHAQAIIHNKSDYHFGMVRPGQYPIKDTTLHLTATNYTVTLAGSNDSNLGFYMGYGIYKVPYIIFWKESGGDFTPLLPNIASQVFRGNNTAMQLVTLRMQIKGNFPHPGHYTDTLTLIITPA